MAGQGSWPAYFLQVTGRLDTCYRKQRNIPLPEFFTLQKLREGDIPLFIAVIELRLAEAAEASKLRSVLSANSKNAGRQGAEVEEDQTEDKTEDGIERSRKKGSGLEHCHVLIDKGRERGEASAKTDGQEHQHVL